MHRGEQRLPGNDVDVEARFLVIPELVPERRLVAFFWVTRYCSGVSREMASGSLR